MNDQGFGSSFQNRVVFFFLPYCNGGVLTGSGGTLVLAFVTNEKCRVHHEARGLL